MTPRVTHIDSAVPKISLIVATYNRIGLLTRLLEQLRTQTLPPDLYEVIVVDDGSQEPVRPNLDRLDLPYRLRVETQANIGAAAARHRGVLAARGAIIAISDDDMQVPPDFLLRHLERHAAGGPKVVLGRIRADPDIAALPLFERWGAYLFDKMSAQLSNPTTPPNGSYFYTGNASFRRGDYLAVGGFDPSLGHSEDVELGLKLEKHGCRFEFSNEAYVLHGPDPRSVERWLKRAHDYGMFDSRIAKKHLDAPHANPWRFLFELNPLARPFLASAALFPHLTRPVSAVVLGAAKLMDRLGLSRLAFDPITVVYTMEYFRGVRREAGSWPHLLDELRSYSRSRRPTRR